VQLLPGSLSPYPCSKKSTKYFSHQFPSSNFALWGEICYTSKLLTSMMTYCRHYKCCKCHISVTSVANIILSSFLCRVSNDIIRTLKTPSKTGLRRRNHLMKSTKLFHGKNHLKMIFEGQCSPTHCQGVLPYPNNAPYPSLGERCNTQDTILGERWDFLKEFWAALPCPLSGSASALYPPLGEHCNALCTLLGEHWPV
jgi:hypothetical protein